jgi:hypothetical protein
MCLCQGSQVGHGGRLKNVRSQFDSEPWHIISGISTVVVRHLAMVRTPVRFRYPAQYRTGLTRALYFVSSSKIFLL